MDPCFVGSAMLCKADHKALDLTTNQRCLVTLVLEAHLLEEGLGCRLPPVALRLLVTDVAEL